MTVDSRMRHTMSTPRAGIVPLSVSALMSDLEVPSSKLIKRRRLTAARFSSTRDLWLLTGRVFVSDLIVAVYEALSANCPCASKKQRTDAARVIVSSCQLISTVRLFRVEQTPAASSTRGGARGSACLWGGFGEWVPRLTGL